MGVWIKSAIGLGGVYFVMFGPALRSPVLQATASLCARTVWTGASLQEKLAAASCAQGAAVQGQRLAAAIALAPVTEAARTAKPTTVAPAGTLTKADLDSPWYGPARAARKPSRI